MKSILFIANNNIGNGLSGGDRIFLELARNWSKKIDITILGSQETLNLLNKYQIKTKFVLTDKTDNSPVFIHQLRRLLKIFPKIPKLLSYDFVYSVSDFIPDSMPALLIKLFSPKIKWLAGYYLNAPNPFSNSSPYNQNNQYFKGLIYYLGQTPIKLLINLFADFVFITSDPDKKYFPNKKIVVIRGGVNTTNSKRYNKLVDQKNTKYQAVFMGRFHPQKGVVPLIDIWKKVTDIIPNAKLAIIGNGSLENQIFSKIKQHKLEKNVAILGFLDGPKKEKIFKQSQIVVHPATYDSGGMAAAEAMAWGLPGVSYDLESLKTYYPQGMIKIPCFDHEIFASKIISLLSDSRLYSKYSTDAKNLIEQHWDWKNQASLIYRVLDL